MAKHKYSEDYELVHTIDDSGRQRTHAEYRGDYYEVSLAESELRPFKRKTLLLLVVAIGLHVAAGFLNNQGMYQFYVVLPYAVGFFPLFNLFQAVLRIPVNKRPLRREEVELSFTRVRSSANTLLLILGVVLVGDVLYLVVFSAPSDRVIDLFFLVSESISAGAIYLITRLQKPIHIEIMKKL